MVDSSDASLFWQTVQLQFYSIFEWLSYSVSRYDIWTVTLYAALENIKLLRFRKSKWNKKKTVSPNGIPIKLWRYL